jgi:hypothetical protein
MFKGRKLLIFISFTIKQLKATAKIENKREIKKAGKPAFRQLLLVQLLLVLLQAQLLEAQPLEVLFPDQEPGQQARLRLQRR